FLSTAAGVYHSTERTITTGIQSQFTGARIPSLAHEWAHWLDNEAGTIAGVRVREYRKGRGKSFDMSFLSEGDNNNKYYDADHTLDAHLIRDARRTMSDEYRVTRLLKVKKGEIKEPELQLVHELVKVRLGSYYNRPR